MASSTPINSLRQSNGSPQAPNGAEHNVSDPNLVNDILNDLENEQPNQNPIQQQQQQQNEYVEEEYHNQMPYTDQNVNEGIANYPNNVPVKVSWYDTILNNVKSPLIVALIIILLSNASVLNLISKISYLANDLGHLNLYGKIATGIIGGLIYLLLNKFVLK